MGRPDAGQICDLKKECLKENVFVVNSQDSYEFVMGSLHKVDKVSCNLITQRERM